MITGVAAPTPTRRREVKDQAKSLRGDRTLDEVGGETLISTSKLSRLENGQGVPQPRDIRDLINFYEADKATADRLRRWTNDGRRQAWWRDYSDALPESADVFLHYESGASFLSADTPVRPPGLLQTEAYATRLLTTILPVYRPEQIGKLAQIRLRRQQSLNSGDTDPTRLLVVIDEAAIQRAKLGEDAPREQLLTLRDVPEQANISIRILSHDVGLHAGVIGRFTDDIDRDAVSTEISSGNGYIEESRACLSSRSCSAPRPVRRSITTPAPLPPRSDDTPIPTPKELRSDYRPQLPPEAAISELTQTRSIADPT